MQIFALTPFAGSLDMIKNLTVGLWLSLTLAAQTFPFEASLKPGNQVQVINSANQNSTTILKNVDPRIYNKLCFRPAFRGYTPPNSYQNFTITVAMSDQVIDPANMSSLSHHNAATYVMTTPRVNFNYPTSQSVFPNGGLDAIIPEPFSYPVLFTNPFNHSTQSNICVTLFFDYGSVLNGIDCFNASYVSSVLELAGAKSAFQDTDTNSFGFGESNLNIRYNAGTDTYTFYSSYPAMPGENIITGISAGITGVYTFNIYSSVYSKTRLDPNYYVPIVGNNIALTFDATYIDSLYAQLWDLGPMTYESSRTVAIKTPFRYTTLPNSRTLTSTLDLNSWFSFILKLDT